MLLFFGYVFGSALAMPGEEYRAFLVPGLLVATAANGIMTGMFQAAQDSHRGVMDRFRTLPISRARSEEHTSELQSLMRISYAVLCLKKKKITIHNQERVC